MKIVLTGGGSGGHIIPILTLALEIKRINPKVRIIYIGQKNDNFGNEDLIKSNFDQVFRIRAGKFRRYPQDGWKQLYDFGTIFKNIGDAFNILIGIIQGYFIIKKIKPNLVFSKGGFISVPVCIDARLNKIKYITHDSDSVASLANRIVAKGAVAHFVGSKFGKYPYSQRKTIFTGIPVDSQFKKVDEKIKNKYKEELFHNYHKKVLLVMGGGLGARDLNNSFIDIVGSLFKKIDDLFVVNIVGIKNIESAKKGYYKELGENYSEKVMVLSFTNELYKYTASADLIITRAGATTLAELSIQGKALIVVPSSYLAAGHQLDNASNLDKKSAIKVVNDLDLLKNKDILKDLVIELLSNKHELDKLSNNLLKEAVPEASKKIANLILEYAS